MKVKSADILSIFQDFLAERLQGRLNDATIFEKLDTDIQYFLDMQYHIGFHDGVGTVLQEAIKSQGDINDDSR